MKLLLSVLFSFVSTLGFSQKDEITVINDVASFSEIVKNKDIQLIDVRTASEYKKGYIANAVNIDIYHRLHFSNSVNKLDKDKPVYLYCHSGVRSKKASNILKGLGFTTIIDFKPGYKGWVKANKL